MRRIVVAAVVLLQAVAGSVVLGAATTSAEAAVACKPYTVIGVRGTDDGARASIGKQLPAAVNAFAAVVDRKNMTVDHVDYPAAAFKVSSNYLDSQLKGQVKLMAKIETYRQVCGTRTKFVLFGYSQGAHVVGDVLVRSTSAVRARIHGVGLIGDPMFNRSLRGSKTGSTLGGMWGKRTSWPSGPFIANVCNKGDRVCASTGKAASLKFLLGNAGQHDYTTKTYSPVAGSTGADYVGRSVALRR